MTIVQIILLVLSVVLTSHLLPLKLVLHATFLALLVTAMELVLLVLTTTILIMGSASLASVIVRLARQHLSALHAMWVYTLMVIMI